MHFKHIHLQIEGILEEYNQWHYSLISSNYGILVDYSFSLCSLFCLDYIIGNLTTVRYRARNQGKTIMREGHFLRSFLYSHAGIICGKLENNSY
jgi:hypothetical protein